MRSFLKALGVGILMIVVALLTVSAIFRPDRLLSMGVATIAHDLCSKTFISGADPSQVLDENLSHREGLDRITGAIRYEVDRVHPEVRAKLFGILQERAKFYPGLGCIVIHGDEPKDLPSAEQLQAARADTTAILPEIADPSVVEPSDPRLRQALDDAFEESGTGGEPHRRTKAVVIVHNGRVIAERYAKGYGVDTPIMGFSLTKSVINSLIGILVMQGRLKVDQPAPVETWAKASDPRHAITAEELMRMTSGLDLDEDDGGIGNPSDQMLFLQRDMVAYAQSRSLKAEPGKRFSYSSGSYQILSGIVRSTAGGSALDAFELADHELFGPLGMHQVTMEVDATGTMIGCNYMFASARDWAKFGLLYSNDGVVGDRRILPAGWIDFSTAPTLGRSYGAGLWTLRGQGPLANALRAYGVPQDAFFATGSFGQRILIIPSLHLVIVRLGDATDPDQDGPGLVRLAGETIAAVRP